MRQLQRPYTRIAASWGRAAVMASRGARGLLNDFMAHTGGGSSRGRNGRTGLWTSSRPGRGARARWEYRGLAGPLIRVNKGWSNRPMPTAIWHRPDTRKRSSLSTRSAPLPRRRATTPTSASAGATARSSCARTRSRACTKTISLWRPRSMSWREHNGATLDRDVAGSTRKRKNLLDGPTGAPRLPANAVHGRSSSPAMLISHLTACQPVGDRCASAIER